MKSLNTATKAEYVDKLSNIATNASVDTNVKTAAVEAKVNILNNIQDAEYATTFTSVTDFKNYLLSDDELKSLNTATKAEYVDKLSNIVTNSTLADIQNTANAQIAQTVIVTKDTDVTQKMINAVDVTKLDETTSPKKSEYLIKLSDIVTKDGVDADVKKVALLALNNNIKYDNLNSNVLVFTLETIKTKTKTKTKTILRLKCNKSQSTKPRSIKSKPSSTNVFIKDDNNIVYYYSNMGKYYMINI